MLEDKQLEEKTNTDYLVKEQEKVQLGIKVGANITVTGVPGQEGAEGNVAEKKKLKESMEANLGKLLKYNAWSTRWSPVDISTVGDTCIWSLAKDDIFSVKEARRVIDDKILPSLATSTSWDKILPRKVNIFMWRLMLDRLPYRLNLSSHGIDIQSISCPSCNGNMESSNHIFFECDIALEVGDLFVYGAISLVILLLLFSIGRIGSVCGKLLKRRSIVYLLSSFRLFGGLRDFAIVSLFVHTR
ncbi:RNA-directed DNA polymerase, eukaryota [Tanacetum coccineum]